MGFVSLDNFTGDESHIYSAEIITCFEQKAWGNFTRYSAKFFLKKCFDELGLYKIKALVYPDNHRISTLLKYAGFKYEATLPKETFRVGQPQDIKQYAIYRTYYYNEVKNENKK
jgi:RimJ/RimL family protein N-acetyltransferase